MSQLFDEAELLDRVDQDWEFLGETVDMLAADAPALVQEIRRAMDAGDATAVGRAAHTLKGMVANFCAAAPHAAAFELERMGKAGDLSGAVTAMDTLESQLLTLTEQLQALVARGR
jgi:HPt (histidine-containing phosphotransfer) domain-containing protein